MSGEAIKPAHADERPVDAPGQILVTPMAGAAPPVDLPRALRPPMHVRPAIPTASARRGGLWLVVLVYLLSAGALGYAIWDRFLR